MPTLLYKNPIPAPAKTDPAYLAGVAEIKTAIASGYKIHATMDLPENGGISQFLVEFSAIKATDNYVCGIIQVRSPINNDAQVVASNGLMAGSVDSLGGYQWGIYKFGGDTWGLSSAYPTTFSSGYAVSWWVP